MRLMYEELFQNCNVVNNEISNKYFAQILSSDMYNVADSSAAETVSELAQQIDTDIERWLESFKLIQNPLTYVPLRLMLNDLVSPDMDQVLQRYDNSLIVQYVVEDVIFQKVWTELDPFDIATTLTSDLIDRLIDNDLYLMSTDSESEIPQKASWREANAIIRKLIRRAVPGRRWLEENERIVTENYNDLFDDLFVQILQNMENPPPVEPSDLIDLRLTPSQGDIRSTDNIREEERTLEPIKDIEEHEVRNKMEKEEHIDSPKVSFHELQVPIIPAKEISPEAYHPPIFLDNKKEQIAEEEPLPLEITPLELDLETNTTHDNLETPKEIKSDVDPIPKKLSQKRKSR